MRVERWKSWRWVKTEHVQQIGTEASQEACVLINGCIGPCTPWTMSSRLAGRRTSTVLLDGSLRAGNASGWEWWVRVVCGLKGEEESDASAAAVVYWIDIVFVSISAADQFVSYLQECVEGMEVVIGDD